MDFTTFITKRADRRKPSVTCLYSKKFAEQKNALNLANGMPNASTFPFEEISVTYTGGTKIKLTEEELAWSLQYGPSQGYLPLLKKMREFQEHWYKPIHNDWDIVLTCGSMEGCSKVLEMVLENGDPIMAQVPTYDGVLSVLMPLEPEFIGIEQDEDGIIPANIANVCEERRRSGKPVPKILYVNPTGGNPTGTVLTDSRKRQIYELAETYNFLILEDDPYSFIHFLDKAPTTFLELDTKGRVIRLDSISKVISPGLRLAFVTAHKEIIKRLILHMEATSIHPSSLGQMLLYKLLNTWSVDELQKHFNNVQRFYRERLDVMLSLIEKHLTGLVEWNVPKGGMFVWVKVNKIKDVMELTDKKCISRGIFVIPGHAFNYDRTKPDQHIRLSYSFSTPEEIDKALSILAELIREEIKKLN